jgi:hypothetical protein
MEAAKAASANGGSIEAVTIVKNTSDGTISVIPPELPTVKVQALNPDGSKQFDPQTNEPVMADMQRTYDASISAMTAQLPNERSKFQSPNQRAYKSEAGANMPAPNVPMPPPQQPAPPGNPGFIGPQPAVGAGAPPVPPVAPQQPGFGNPQGNGFGGNPGGGQGSV